MSVWRRASLYMMRKKGKFLILLAILTVIATLVLLCISVGNAANSSVQKLRETMGGYFKIEPDYEQGYSSYVDDRMVQKVMDTGEIKAYNGTDIRYMLAEDIELEPGRFTAERDPKAKLARILGNTDSSLNENFVLGYDVLTEGRHIEPGDEGKALISEELAGRNHLSVGDTFSMKLDDEMFSGEGKKKITSHTLEVVGIYRIEASQVISGNNTAECDLAENFVFTDTEYIRKVYGERLENEIDAYTDGVTFFVKNPKKLEEIIEEIAKLEEYDRDGFVITKNNKIYEDSAVPLERLSGLVTIMVFVIVIISAVMLSLIFFLWMRDRMHEIGIYLSVGIRKTEIVRQHILENLAAAVLAFFLAWGLAGAASGTVEQIAADSFLEDSQTSEIQEVETVSFVEVHIGMLELAEVAGTGFLIILVSAGISSAAVLKMNPKDILSMMS